LTNINIAFALKTSSFLTSRNAAARGE